MSIVTNIKSHLPNILGWRTNRKIVVFESDDWGMTRMPSKKDYDYFKSIGFRVQDCSYNKNDNIESNDDLEFLFDVLADFKDLNGAPAVFTFNNVVANPDFEKIKEDNFEKYHYEVFTKTLERYNNRNRVIDLYNEGMSKKVMKPQFHAREHVNVNRWMQDLKAGNKTLRLAFERNLYSIHKEGVSSGRREYLDAFGLGYDKSLELESIESILEDGLDIFHTLWGFPSKSFIAPCYIWPPEIEDVLKKKGVKYIQGIWVQKNPVKNQSLAITKIRRFQGQKNKLGQKHLVRNVVFEPSEKPNFDWVDSALSQIRNAFFWKKPAIISTHRVNYIGSIHSENRDNSLIQLRSLIQKIVKTWPEVEFMSSDEFGDIL